MPGFTVVAVTMNGTDASATLVRRSAQAQNDRANTVPVKKQMFLSSKRRRRGWSGAAVEGKQHQDRRQ